jgi:transcription antitermination protein NusB
VSRSPGIGQGAGLDPAERLHRRRARSWAMQVLYRWESEGGDRALRESFQETLRTRRMHAERIPLVDAHLLRVETHLDAVDEALEASMDNWRLDRLSRVDRSVLRLAASEILFAPQVPPRVALQEGIRLAGQYGGPDSPRFVNGVLDAVMRRSRRPR